MHCNLEAHFYSFFHSFFDLGVNLEALVVQISLDPTILPVNHRNDRGEMIHHHNHTQVVQNQFSKAVIFSTHNCYFHKISSPFWYWSLTLMFFTFFFPWRTLKPQSLGQTLYDLYMASASRNEYLEHALLMKKPKVEEPVIPDVPLPPPYEEPPRGGGLEDIVESPKFTHRRKDWISIFVCVVFLRCVSKPSTLGSE